MNIRESSHVAVLDIESTPDGRCIANSSLPRGDIKRWCLHRVAAAALLTAELRADGTWTGFDLQSWQAGEDDEDRLLQGLDAALAPVMAGTSTLITYNGRRHDLEVLRRRAGANLRMDLRALATLRELSAARHRDMMTIVCGNARDRMATLGDAIAPMGVGIDHDSPLPFKVSTPSIVRKCHADVIATFLLHLQEASLDSGSAVELLDGWGDLGAYLRPRARMWPHLAHFAFHPNARSRLEAAGAPASA